MFYEEAQIADLLKCPKCNKRFDDARILPCGQTMCSDCIENLSNKLSNTMKCSLCQGTHQITKENNGFPVNKLIMQLLDLHPSEVYRSKLVEQLKIHLDSLNRKTTALSNDLKQIPGRIKEKTLSVRTKIDLAAEMLIQEIHKHRDNLFRDLDNYEKECLQNEAKNGPEFVKKVESVIGESLKFQDEFRAYLSKSEIREERVSEANVLALGHLGKLSQEEISLRNFTYNNKTLTFLPGSPEICSSKIGTISFENRFLAFAQKEVAPNMVKNSDQTDVATLDSVQKELDSLFTQLNKSSGSSATFTFGSYPVDRTKPKFVYRHSTGFKNH
jgi:hypothetical protein